MLKIPVLVGGLSWQPCFHGNGSCRGNFYFFSEAVNSIFPVSEQGGGRKGMEGWGAVLVRLADGVLLFRLLFSHWMTSVLSNKAKRCNKSASKRKRNTTKPSVMRFCEQISAALLRSTLEPPDSEQVIFKVWMIWKKLSARCEGYNGSADLLRIIVCKRNWHFPDGMTGGSV